MFSSTIPQNEFLYTILTHYTHFKQKTLVEFLFRIAYKSRRHIPGETVIPIKLYNIGTTEIMNTRRNPSFNIWYLHTILAASKITLNLS